MPIKEKVYKIDTTENMTKYQIKLLALRFSLKCKVPKNLCTYVDDINIWFAAYCSWAGSQEYRLISPQNFCQKKICKIVHYTL